MALQDTLCYVGIIVLVSPVSTQNTSSCGVFSFESPEIVNDILYVKETTRVNITFTVQTTNCSNTTFDEIEIFKNDSVENVFSPQCKIYKSCDHRPEFKMSCNCLETPGYYSFTFIANRIYNTQWKWSMKQIQDAVITFEISYQARVNALEIVGYDGYIPRYKPVTIVCTWENGNPPTSVVLLDGHNSVLANRNTSGNMSYTFPHVVCSQAGVIRCEADRSDRNMSTVMLIECPPEFRYTSSGFQSLTIRQNEDVAFPFRSHTSNISSCHINVNGETVFTVFNCAKARENESDSIGETLQCFYSVTGEPPDLHLIIHFRNMVRKYNGLWSVNISNNLGSGVVLIQVNIKVDNDLPDVQTNTTVGIEPNEISSPYLIVGVVLAVTVIIVIVFIIVYYIRKGKGAYDHLRRKRKKEMALYRNLTSHTVEASQRQSEIYYEIQDSQLETDLQSTVRTISVEVSDVPSHNPHSVVESTNDDEGKSMDYFQSAHEQTENSSSSDASASIKQIQTESTTSSQSATEYSLAGEAESQKREITPVADYLKLIQKDNVSSGIRRRSEYLKLNQTGDETNNAIKKSDYLMAIQADCKTNNNPVRSDYLRPVQAVNETSNVLPIHDYLEVVQTGSETVSSPPTSLDYLEPVQVENKTKREAIRPEV